MNRGRRELLRTGEAALLLTGIPYARAGARAHAQVVVAGGGFAGATAAKHLRFWSRGTVDVTLVEPNPGLASCPLSNLVLAGARTLGSLTHPYESLSRRWGVRVIHHRVTEVDPRRREIRLGGGPRLAGERIVLAPGIDFVWDRFPSLAGAQQRDQVLHPWIAGPQTLELARRLRAMPDGGLCVVTVPRRPYRCPPGPFERASPMAHYFKTRKPRAKVLVLDANEDIRPKGELFRKAWNDLYPGIVE
jgi:sulfide dehydrogenase [flavocytochrome c] flavoprotein subunit